MATTEGRLAAIYARVSVEERREGTAPSTETQVAECRMRANGLTIPVASDDSGLIVQEEHSGTDLRWAGTKFMRLVERARSGEFTDLICLNVDRFCRAGADAFREQLQLLEHEGVKVHFVQLPLPESMPFRSSVQGFIADAAQYWRDGIVEASVRVRENYAAAGNFIPGNTPAFGFEFVEDPTRRTRRDRPVKVGLRVHPVNGPALLHMTEHVANGGSVGSLKRWLEEQGIETPKGAAVWHEATIRRILHNPINWGERRSFNTHVVPRPNAVRRPAHLKTAKTREVVPLDKQYLVRDEHVERIPGLTKELAMRALARLAENEEQSSRRATVPEEERAARGLLFGGVVKCATCGGGMRLKHHYTNGGWIYVCYHTGTAHEGEPSISMTTKQLDAFAWHVAVGSIKDPAFLERLARATDEESGPLAHARSLQRSLDEATADHERYQRQRRKLDPDDPDDAPLLTDVLDDVRRAKARIAELTAALEANQALIEEDEQRRASLAAFRAYAEAERPTLERKTPIERHRMLRALKTRAKLYPDGHYPRLRVAFDIRHLPGAIEQLAEGAEHPDFWSDWDYTFSAASEVLVNEEAVAFQEPDPATVGPDVWELEGFSSEDAWVAHVKAGEAWDRAFLAAERDFLAAKAALTDDPASVAAFRAAEKRYQELDSVDIDTWYRASGSRSARGGTLKPAEATQGVPAARTYS